MPTLETTAQVLGRRVVKRSSWYGGGEMHYTWVKLPTVWPTKILTLTGDEDPLPWGMRTADELLVRVDTDSFSYDGDYYTADLEFIDVIQGKTQGDEGEPGGDTEGSSGEALDA